MRPTTGVHQPGGPHRAVTGIAIGLQQPSESGQKLLRPFATTAQPEIKIRTPARLAVLPQVCLVIFAAAIMQLHRNRRFICLNTAV